MDNLIPVKSSHINAVGYSKEDKELFVQFKTGVIYKYLEVGEEVFNELLNAPSIGSFFHAYIKDRFESVRVDNIEVDQ